MRSDPSELEFKRALSRLEHLHESRFDPYRTSAKKSESMQENEKYEDVVSHAQNIEVISDLSDEETKYWIDVYRDIAVDVKKSTGSACRCAARDYADYAIWCLRRRRQQG